MALQDIVLYPVKCKWLPWIKYVFTFVGFFYVNFHFMFLVELTVSIIIIVYFMI